MKALTALSFAVALVGMLAASTANAAPPVYFKAPVQFRGTGCPNGGSVDVVGANTDTMTVLFGRYDAGKNSISRLNRAACSFAVPVHVPKGWQVSVMTADWMGFVQGRGQLSRRYFFAGSPLSGVNKTDSFNSRVGEDFVKRDGLLHTSYTSGCSPQGRDLNMRVNSSVRAITPASYMAVDTLDLKNKVVFQLKWAPCR